MRPRLSVARMMGVVMLLALGFTAMLTASALWASLMYTTQIVVLLTAALGFLLKRGTERAAWLGFVVFGWGYFLLAFGPWLEAEITPLNLSSALEVNPHLATTVGLSYLYARTNPPPKNEYKLIQVWDRSSRGPKQYAQGVFWKLQQAYFQRIGHSMICLIFAMTGAFLGPLFAAPYSTDIQHQPDNAG